MIFGLFFIILSTFRQMEYKPSSLFFLKKKKKKKCLQKHLKLCSIAIFILFLSISVAGLIYQSKCHLICNDFRFAKQI